MNSIDWTNQQNDAIVADYFEMIQSELSKTKYNKAAHNRILQQKIGRSKGSIEFKHQNVSAVLKGLGEVWINGYKPAFNYQASLVEAVDRWMHLHPEWMIRAPATEAGFNEASSLFLEPPPTLRNAPPPSELEQTLAVARKFDAAGRDERNRALGSAGEARVFESERFHLRQQGRADLAGQVEWTSKTQGDGAGFDISSFETNGKRRLIEVKTTNGWERTPFYISRNELAVADQQRDEWKLVRVWNFSRSPRTFEISPPLDQHVSLTATSFQANFH